MTKNQEGLLIKLQRWKEDGFNDLMKFNKAIMEINNYPYELPDAYTNEKYLQALNYVLSYKDEFWKEFENERKTQENNNHSRSSSK